MRGEWRQAHDTLASLPCWGLLMDKEGVLGMLHLKLREQGLIVYLHAYSAFYHSLSHQHLMSLFELPEAKVGRLGFIIMVCHPLSGFHVCLVISLSFAAKLPGPLVCCLTTWPLHRAADSSASSYLHVWSHHNRCWLVVKM